MTVAALLLAGGRGTRAGGGIPKQYREIGGISVLRRAIDCFIDCPAVDLIRVVIHADDQELYRAATAGLDILPPVIGGTERHLSAVNGLKSLSDFETNIVLIHDAARPFADRGMIERVIAALADAAGAIPALPVSDTLKRVASTDDLIEETVDRAGLWRAQTPQGFRFKAILKAHGQRDSDLPTDDAAVMEEAGMVVCVVDGDERNIKVTTEADFDRAEQILEKRQMQTRVGSGFDVHKLGPGDGVTLCGVKVPCDMSLIGHSDADVALHALTDALLGAVGCGDIGLHFPPSDPQWKGAASHIFVEAAAADIRKAGGSIVNVDVTIIGEHPKVGPHREEMRARVAEYLDIPLDRVNIKATTTERLGFTGRGEGLAAQAVASVEVPAT
ncbi:MAG: bifunctional 2-C-methyl-D-erythritol 4-phosphate cytidylyltransferase/2-C-methyl-D-erythritol 2,4-cyclodiphosphate synthase [Alphaproteobacteria bacterium]|jgi:2-C-methyl-D-erythritol 4-phosphate cytidylyltransferase / 2-C-methyl-D-erythritol 2,4-cyclodiphosphate synthase|nr:bifunctional 2-C-methyl-D-erythritol 4-phosphate cytidylyltransferase/2-C-methyl-D-erythritol 2,4-cyclodiphosphate synthase [Alphaproteobacteria bacterium]